MHAWSTVAEELTNSNLLPISFVFLDTFQNSISKQNHLNFGAHVVDSTHNEAYF